MDTSITLAGHSIYVYQLALGLLLLLAGLGLGFIIWGRKQRPNLVSRPADQKIATPEHLALKPNPHDETLHDFIDDMVITPVTVGIYHEMGTLFRQKGEMERAILLRQRIIDDAGLPLEEKIAALFELGLDYRQTGLLNKAIDTFNELIQIAPQHADAGRHLVYLYEETREWDKAISARRRVDKILGKTSPAILAHYKTELAKELEQSNPTLAEQNFGQAIKIHNQCLDAYLHLGDLYLKHNRLHKAFDIWRTAAQLKPSYAHLILTRLRGLDDNSIDLDETIGKIFPDSNKIHPLALLELAKWYLSKNMEFKAMLLLNQALSKAPGFMAAHDLRGQLLVKQNHNTPLMNDYKKLLAQIQDSTSTSYRCNHCGFTSYNLSWQCPRCRHWDSIEVLTI